MRRALAQCGEPCADVLAARLHQPVGAQHQPVPRLHRHRRRLERHPADADRRARRHRQQLAAAVRAAHQHRGDVPRVGDLQPRRDRVVHRVQAGGEVLLAEPLGQVVQAAQQAAGRQVETRHGLHRGAQLTHHRRRVETVAHHVADHQRDPRSGEPHRVDPVTAHPSQPGPGQVAGGQLAAGQPWGDLGQHALLERLGDPLLTRVHARVVQHQAGAGGEFGGGDPVHVVERRAVGAAHQHHEAQHRVACLERDGQEGAAPDQRAQVPLLEPPRDPLPQLVGDPLDQHRLAGDHALEEGGLLGEPQGLADRHGVVPAARLVVVFHPHPAPDRRHVRHAVREALARRDLRPQVRPGEVAEAGHRRAGDLADGAGQVQRAADPAADLVEELQSLTDRRALQVGLGGVRPRARVGGRFGPRRGNGSVQA